MVQGWHNQSMANYGVLLKAHRLDPSVGGDLLIGDQHLHFARDAVLLSSLASDRKWARGLGEAGHERVRALRWEPVVDRLLESAR